MRQLAYALAVAATALAGCYNPTVQSGKIQCSSGHQCPEGFTCFPDNKCYTTGSHPTCNPTCAAPMPVCDTTTLSCVACLADTDCSDGTLCVEKSCRPGCSASHMGCAPDAGTCDVDMGVCRGCIADAECTDPNNPRCDTTTQTCVACLPTNDNCATGTYCNHDVNGNYTCTAGCKADNDCPLGANMPDMMPPPPDLAHPDLKGADLGGLDMMPAPQPKWACCNHVCADVTKASDNCGSCGNVCAGTTCCESSCVDTAKDVNNCGTCGNRCNLPHTTSSTCAGTCRVGACAAGYLNCNKADVDGCEASILSDVNNCGACGKVCPAVANGAAACKNGVCAIGACNTGYADCDMSYTNGCEVALGTDVNNCGACKNVCPTPQNGTAACVSGTCGVASCNTGFANCSGNSGGGCTTNLQTDVNNCGSCKNVCTIANGTATCSSGKCAVSTCNKGFADCDNNPANGCETNTTDTAAHCGSCSTSCGSQACCASACVETTSDINNCGSCGNACGSGQVCQGGHCITTLVQFSDYFPNGGSTPQNCTDWHTFQNQINQNTIYTHFSIGSNCGGARVCTGSGAGNPADQICKAIKNFNGQTISTTGQTNMAVACNGYTFTIGGNCTTNYEVTADGITCSCNSAWAVRACNGNMGSGSTAGAGVGCGGGSCSAPSQTVTVSCQ